MLYTLIRTIHVQFMSVSALCVCVYQAVAGRLFGDLLLGGLLFVSGYTHFTHYWIHADFSWKRLATVSDGELLVHLHVHYSMFIYPDHDVHSYLTFTGICMTYQFGAPDSAWLGMPQSKLCSHTCTYTRVHRMSSELLKLTHPGNIVKLTAPWLIDLVYLWVQK